MNGSFRRMGFARLFTLNHGILLGFVVAVIPLLVAVLYAASAMRETSALGKAMNRQVFEQTNSIRLVLQKSSDIERKARLFVLFSDPALRKPDERQSYENVRASFKQALDGLLQSNLDNAIALRVNELAEKERLIYEQIIGSDSGDTLKLPVDEAFQGLREASNTLSREFESHVEREFDALNQESASLERGVLVKGAILLLVSLGFITILLTLLSRPIRQLDVATRQLVAGNRQQPISINGTRDLRRWGERLDWLRTRWLDSEESKYQLIDTVASGIEKPLESMVELSAKLAEDADGEFDPQRLETAMQLSSHVESLQAVSAQLRRVSQASLNPVNPDSTSASRETVDMKVLLESVIQAHQTRLQAKSLTVEALAQPVEVLGIPGQLHSVVDHLLSNAIKHSPEGGEISILLRTAGLLMELEIADEGPGFDPDRRAKSFQPAFLGNAASANTSESENVGFCLAKVGEVVASHQGRVEIVESKQQLHGARIRVQLPLREDA